MHSWHRICPRTQQRLFPLYLECYLCWKRNQTRISYNVTHNKKTGVLWKNYNQLTCTLKNHNQCTCTLKNDNQLTCTLKTYNQFTCRLKNHNQFTCRLKNHNQLTCTLKNHNQVTCTLKRLTISLLVHSIIIFLIIMA